MWLRRAAGRQVILDPYEASLAIRRSVARFEFEQELRVELRHRYDLLALEREAEELDREAKALRDPWWLRGLRWFQGWLGGA